MKIENVVQGSQEWLDIRAGHFTASEAPAMLGLSKYKTRAELLREKATGVVRDVDEATQRRFDAGHAAETATRAWAEREIGHDLFPSTGTNEVDGLHLLASFDGITMDDSVSWENKLWNAEFAAQVLDGIVPDTHWPQLEHQMLVSGARKVLFTVSDGGNNIVSMWYESIPGRRAQVIAGWKQFAEDVANYEHVETQAPVIGRAPETLPALHVEVTGMVTASNLLQFKETALAVFKGINTDLQTDADFADAEKTVKWCKGVEDRLEQTKQHALSQTASIDELFQTMDAIKEEAKAVRLKLDKLVKGEKENRKAEIVTQARKAIEQHVAELNTRIGGNWMPLTSSAVFAEVIKGLKSIDSMRDKVGTALSNAKIEANAMADRILINKDSLTPHDWPLVPDFAAICTKEPGDFTAIVAMRAQKRKEDDELRLEVELARIRQEEEDRAKANVEAEQIKARTAEVNKEIINEVNPAQAFTPEAKREAVIEHQDEIKRFIALHDFDNPHQVRAILVEFVKFQAASKALGNGQVPRVVAAAWRHLAPNAEVTGA